MRFHIRAALVVGTALLPSVVGVAMARRSGASEGSWIATEYFVAVVAVMAGGMAYTVARTAAPRWTLAGALTLVAGAAILCALWRATSAEQLLRAAGTAPLFAWQMPLALEMGRRPD
jgi:hypothetical protein